jgi:RNA polymerase sigma-70 factor (ECF subfamily)
MLPVRRIPIPGPVDNESPVPLHVEAANDLSTTALRPAETVTMGDPQTPPPVEGPPSFELLYAVARTYLPDTLRLLRVPPGDIDDIVQDAVLVAMQGLPRFAPRAGPGGGPPDARRSLRAWLSAIAWRLASRRRGRAYRRFELPLGDPADLAGAAEGSPSSEQLAAAEQRRRILAGVVDTLRPERAEVLLMHAFLDMSVPDIAEELGLNPNTVKSRLARARADALAAVRRLSEDEQSILEGSLLMLPLLDVVDGAPPPRAPRSRVVRGASRAAGAAAMLALGVALGAGLRVKEAPIVAAVDRDRLADAPADLPTHPPTPAPPSPALPPSQAASRAPSSVKSDSLARELVWITAARRAIQKHAGERALAALKAHEAEFPRGVLAHERELLGQQARALAGPR